MLALLSPAKNLNLAPGPSVAATAPRLAADTAELAQVAKGLSRGDLRGLMDISDALAELNHARFQAFDPDATDGVPAAFAFDGEVYRGLDARSLASGALDHAQARLRILSGLYGLLRPLDTIAPYRLEMGTRLTTPRGRDLYAFWGERIADLLRADLDALGGDTVVNLASEEYAKAVDRRALGARVIEVAFHEIKDGKARPLFMYVKRARGLMARFIAEHRIVTAADLRAFDVEGYRFVADGSTENAWVFARPQPAAKSARAAARAS